MSEFQEPEKKKKTKPSAPAPAAQTVQRDLKDVNGPEGGMLPSDVSAKIQSLRGGGQRLSDRQLQSYSQKFGRDMSDVHIHTDAQSDTISRSLNARAFTIGSDVFLTKGINPTGTGRDEQTMTHELTHVVQQNGRAGYGALKLGAADTAQEHEAESTAQRQFEPAPEASEPGAADAAQREFDSESQPEEETEAQREFEPAAEEASAPKIAAAPEVQRETEPTAGPADTIQRGFWSNLGRGLLTGMNMGGVLEAYDDFMSGDHKVRAAIKKMDESQQEAYKSVEDRIKSMEGGQLESAKKNVEAKQQALSNTVNGGSGGASPSASEIQQAQAAVQDAGSEYDELKAEYQGLLNQQLKMLQDVDQTVTAHDVNKYRTGKGKAMVASIFASVGGNFLAGFKSGDKAKSAARAKGMKRISNWWAASGKGSAEFEEEPEEAEETEEEKEAKAKEAQRKQSELITAVWQDVQADDKLKSYYGSWILFKRTVAKEHSDMIQESIKDGESDADIKAAVLEALTRKAEESMNKPTPATPEKE